jgi:endonuclease VIII
MEPVQIALIITNLKGSAKKLCQAPFTPTGMIFLITRQTIIHMPEGPSLVILKEQLQPFTGKKVTAAGGYTPMDTRWIAGCRLLEVNAWGKHLLLRFSRGTVRVHLMLFGSVLVNKRKKVNASFFLRFNKEFINFYVVQAQRLEGKLADIYDWRTDIMSDAWNAAQVKKLIKEHAAESIGDLLLNQQVFTGVGNIIRVEALFRSRIHPLSVCGSIPAKVLSGLLKEVRKYGQEFLEQRKKGTLSRNWQAYDRKTCPRDEVAFRIDMPGRAKRKTYYCEKCQVRYGTAAEIVKKRSGSKARRR